MQSPQLFRTASNREGIYVIAKQLEVGKHVSYLLAAMKMITATMIVPQIAALAAMVILSMLEAWAVTVRTSLHC
jgi:hypothetical protein